MASSPIVWTPDKRMILQSAVADLSPEAFQGVVGKVFAPASHAMRRRWSPRDRRAPGQELWGARHGPQHEHEDLPQARGPRPQEGGPPALALHALRRLRVLHHGGGRRRRGRWLRSAHGGPVVDAQGATTKLPSPVPKRGTT